MMITSMDGSDDNDGNDEDSHGSGGTENDHDDCASNLSTRKSLGNWKKLLEGLDGSYWRKTLKFSLFSSFRGHHREAGTRDKKRASVVWMA